MIHLRIVDSKWLSNVGAVSGVSIMFAPPQHVDVGQRRGSQNRAGMGLWPEVGAIIFVIAFVVWFMDTASAYIREALR